MSALALEPDAEEGVRLLVGAAASAAARAKSEAARHGSIDMAAGLEGAACANGSWLNRDVRCVGEARPAEETRSEGRMDDCWKEPLVAGEA